MIVAKARAAKDLPEVADTLLALMREARTPSEKRKCAQAIARFAGELPNHQVTLNVAQASSPTVAVSNLNDTELAHWLDAVAHGLAEVREAKRHEAPETNGHEPRE